jgi:hypothetical protein
MYINTQLLESRGLTANSLIMLQLIKQNKTEDMSSIIELHGVPISILDLGLVEFIKPKNKSQKESHTIRLSKKGSKWLNEFTETVLVSEEDVIVFDWLKNLYEGLGKEVGSHIKCKNLISWFRRESGISKNCLIELCKEFTSDDNRMEYSNILEYVFWRGANHFQTSPKLEDSKLWNYYEKRQDYFDNRFKDLER